MSNPFLMGIADAECRKCGWHEEFGFVSETARAVEQHGDECGTDYIHVLVSKTFHYNDFKRHFPRGFGPTDTASEAER